LIFSILLQHHFSKLSRSELLIVLKSDTSFKELSVAKNM
jgi:hypothetical protein